MHQLDDFLTHVLPEGGRGSWDQFSSCSLSPLPGVFNASENLGKLHRLESVPKCRQCLINLSWNSENVNVHPVHLKARSPEKFMDVSFFTKIVLCSAA